MVQKRSCGETRWKCNVIHHGWALRCGEKERRIDSDVSGQHFAWSNTFVWASYRFHSLILLNYQIYCYYVCTLHELNIHHLVYTLSLSLMYNLFSQSLPTFLSPSLLIDLGYSLFLDIVFFFNYYLGLCNFSRSLSYYIILFFPLYVSKMLFKAYIQDHFHQKVISVLA